MYKLIKIVSGIVIALIALIVIGIIALVNFVNPNIFKPQIATAISAHTNHQAVTISGNVSWKIFPWIGINIKQIAINNTPGFSNPMLLQADSAELSCKLLPLIHKQLQFGSIYLYHPQLNLEINHAGESNWSGLQVASHSAQATQKPQTEQTYILNINNLRIIDAQITWIDQRSQKKISLEHFNVNSQHINFGHAFPINATFVLHAPNLSANLQTSVQGDFIIKPQEKHYHINHLTIQAQDLNQVNTRISKLFIEDVIYNGIVNELKVSNYKFNSPILTSKGHVTISDVTRQPLTEGYIQLQTQPRLLLHSLGYTLENDSPGEAKLLTQLNAKANFKILTKQINFTQINGHIDHTIFRGNLQITPNTLEQVNFNLQLNHINLDNYARFKIEHLNRQIIQGTGNVPTVAATAAASTTVTHKQPLAIDGNVSVQHLTIHHLLLSNVQAHINDIDQIMNIDPWTANGYGGSLSGRINIDHHQALTNYSIDTHLVNVNLQQLSKHKYISGKANLDLTLATTGTDNQSRLQNLTGKVSITANNGHIEGIDLIQAIKQAVKFTSNKSFHTSPKGNSSTYFSKLTAAANLHAGVATNSHLLLLSPQLRTTGNGYINLINQSINYHLQLTPLHGIHTKKDNIAINIKDITIPVIVTGTIDKPKLRPDYNALNSGAMKQNLQIKLEDVLGKSKNSKMKKNLQKLEQLLQ